MKKIFLLFISIILLTGCGKVDKDKLIETFKDKVESSKSYTIDSNMEIYNSEDTFTYNIKVYYMDDDYFKVDMVNTLSNHEQIILKNDEGVYVLTPSLNKSFKFQSDWPYNNSQTYLLQTLLSDIQNDDKKEFKTTTNHYIFTTTVNYPNNNDLVKQNIYFDKKLNPKKVEVLNKEGDVMIKMTFKKVDLKAEFKDNYFNLEQNMKTAKTESKTKTVSKIEGDTYPMYVPENTKLASKDTVDLDGGQRVIMTFEGDNPFMFVEQTANVEDELAIVSVYGEPFQLATSVAAVSDNMVSWVSNGIEYYIVADNMSKDDLMNVANSVSAMPVSK